jgi:hypothetical protein
MRLFLFKIMGLFFIPAFLFSCAPTSLVDTWHNPDLTIPKQYKKLLLVYIPRHEINSRLYEDVLASELKRRGVASVSGYSIFADEKKVNKQIMAKGIGESGADAVLTLQTKWVEKRTAEQPALMDIFPGWDDIEPGTLYDAELNVIKYEIADIHVNFFDGHSGKLLWAATIRTSEPGNRVSVSKALTTIVVNSLFREGLI